MSQGFLPFDTEPEEGAPERDPKASRDPAPKPRQDGPSPLPELFGAEPAPEDPEVPEPPHEGGTDDARSADTRAREQVQSVFDRPLVLEAGAGTGKTATLVARIVTWATGPGWERAREALGAEADATRIAARTLSRITSITFTEAAAADMADRVARGLAAIGRDELPPGMSARFLPPPELRRERARALSLALEHLEVSTIHAYCRRLLGEATFEARLHPAFEVDPEFEQCARVTREVLEHELHEAWAQEGDHAHLQLAAEGRGPAELEELLFQLVITGTPVRALQAEPVSPERVRPQLDALAAELDALLEILRELAGRVRASSKLASVAADCEKAREALELVRGLEGPPLEPLDGLHRILDEVQDDVHDRLARWAQSKLSQEEARELEAAGRTQEELAAAADAVDRRLTHLAAVRPRLLRALCTALAPLLARVYDGLRARGIETFDGLLQKTARLLATQPGIVARIRSRTDLLCVDEFQDTDRLQYEILTHLALAESAAPPPALFLVGDPKQSIYGWRNADLAAYDAFVARVRAAGGEVHELVVNFRSVPPILAEVERVLAGTMVRREGLQPAFRTLLASEKKAAEARAPAPLFDVRDAGAAGDGGALARVEYWNSWDFEEGGEPDLHRGRATEVEARGLAAELADLGTRPGFQWRHAALLLRSMTDLDVYLGALREAGVPYVVERDRNYYRRREIVEAVAWLNAVLRPHDTLSLVSFLRSVHVGVPDAAWIPLWAHGFPAAVARLAAPEGDAMANLENRVRAAARDVAAGAGAESLAHLAGWEDCLLEALWTLARLRESFRSEPLSRFVARLRDGLALEATESARFLGAFRVANLDRFFRDLEARFEAERGDHHTVLRALNRDVHLKQEATEARPKDSVEDAVRVMTFHMSKGLDFRHVYLGQLHKDLRAPRFDEDVTWEALDAEGRGGEDSAPIEFSLRGVRSYGFDRIERRRSAVEYAERLRLLYVAMTRAEDRLVVMGAWPDGAPSQGPDRSRALMDLVAHRQPPPPELRGLAADLQDEDRSRREVEGVAWVFPALAVHGRTGAARRTEEAFPDAAAAAADIRAWSGRVARARARQARPWSRAATELEAPAGSAAGDHASALPPDLARAVGTAVHRELELAPPAGPDAERRAEGGAAAARERLRGALASELPGGAVDRALEAAVELLERFHAGPLGQRLGELEPHVLGRELAVWLPAPEVPDRPGGAATPAPVGYLSGRIDLVYRDPQTGELVVADYKTDDLPDAAACRARAEEYRAQGELYGRALQEGLDLPGPPRLEFWFLAQDLVVELPPSAPGP